MFLPAIEEELNRQKQKKVQKEENRLYIPEYFDSPPKKDEEEEKPVETVIHIQLT